MRTWAPQVLNPLSNFCRPSHLFPEREDITEFVTVFDDQPFQGGQISPRIAKWVNEDVFLFIQFDKPSPLNATALNYIGIGKRGIFCESDRPSPDFVHFHKWNATSYREGHGH